MVRVETRDIDQIVAATIAHENEWQFLFANLALELVPMDDGAVRSGKLFLLSFKPVLETQEVYKLDATPASANSEQGIVPIVVLVPTKSAAGIGVRVDAYVVLFFK